MNFFTGFEKLKLNFYSGIIGRD